MSASGLANEREGLPGDGTGGVEFTTVEDDHCLATTQRCGRNSGSIGGLSTLAHRLTAPMYGRLRVRDVRQRIVIAAISLHELRALRHFCCGRFAMSPGLKGLLMEIIVAALACALLISSAYAHSPGSRVGAT